MTLPLDFIHRFLIEVGNREFMDFQEADTNSLIEFNHESADINFQIRGDTDTALFWLDAGEDAIGIGYGSADLVSTTGILLVDGNVGIGTATPQALLHVSDANVGNIILRVPEVLNNTFNINFQSGLSDVLAPGNATVHALITGKVTQAVPSALKGELQFYTNIGDSIQLALTLDDTLNATFAGTIDSGAITSTAGIIVGGDIVSDTDSTDNLGSYDKQWYNIYTDMLSCATATTWIFQHTGLNSDAYLEVNDGGSQYQIWRADASEHRFIVGRATVANQLLHVGDTNEDGWIQLQALGSTTVGIHMGSSADFDEAGIAFSVGGVMSFWTGSAGMALTPAPALEPGTGSSYDLGANAMRWKDLYLSGNADITGTLGCGAITNEGGAIFNEAGADVDFRIEGSGNANLFFIDAGNNRVGIGTATPLQNFQVDSSTGAWIHLTRTAADTSSRIGRITFGNLNVDNALAEIQVIADGSTSNSQMQLWTEKTGSSARRGVTILSDQKVGIGHITPTAKLEVGTGATEAVTALALSQLDTEYPFINFKGTAAAGAAATISTTEYSTFQNMLQIEINGTKYWLKAYTE